MGLQLAGMAALVKSFIPALAPRPSPSDQTTAEAPAAPVDAVAATGVADGDATASLAISAETEAALAPLELPPDGPIDTTVVLRARHTPEVAAANFVRWARALDLEGCYSKRSMSALYREFSEVDHRLPVGDTQLFQALDHVKGVRKEQLCLISGKTKFRLAWQWIIEPVATLRDAGNDVPMVEAPKPVAAMPVAPPLPVETKPALIVPAPVEPAPLAPVADNDQAALPAARPARPVPLLTRFVLDDHPFSPAGLREHAKHARRARLNAAASRKQRGGVRRAN